MNLALSFLGDFLDLISNTTLSISTSDINIPTLLTFYCMRFLYSNQDRLGNTDEGHTRREVKGTT